MADTNQDILNKTDMVFGDLPSGGTLPVEKAKKFIRMVKDTPTILNECRVQEMESSEMEVGKLGFGETILKAPNATGGIDSDKRSTPGFGNLTLSAKKKILAVRIPFDVLTLNVEKEQFEQTLMEEIAARLALDLQHLLVNGDTASSDDLLKLHDGIVKLGNVRKDFSGAEFSDKTVTAYLMNEMEERFQTGGAMRVYSSFKTRVGQLAAISDRGTALGDAVLKGEIDPPTMGVPMRSCASLKNNVPKGELTDTSHAFYCDPRNVVFGMMQKIKFWRKEEPEEQHLVIVGALWTAQTVDEVDGIGVAEYLGKPSLS